MTGQAFFDEVHTRYGDRRLFVRHLRASMILHNITQGALARTSGFCPTQVNKWLSGRRTPTMDTMVILDEALQSLLNEDEV